MGSHMGVMEAAEARSGVTPKVITFIPNKRPATTAGKIKEIVIAPIAVIIWAVIAVVIAVVVHWAIYARTSGYGEEGAGAQDQFEFLVHDKPLVLALEEGT
jgi:phosphotransferase system  glucose/maltose/N-acetylglucosamine-specific IIC component